VHAATGEGQEDERLLPEIRRYFECSNQTYGSKRILRGLREAGNTCGRHRVARLMRQAGMKAVVSPRFVVTTDSNHSLPVAQNLLSQDFGAEEANVKWASDIPYVWTREGWLYLAVVLDLFSPPIRDEYPVVGWSMQQRLERSLVVTALQAALCQRHPEGGLMHHSDRGSQYASGDFQALLKENSVTCSRSRRGNCYDNAVVESFFGTLKQELVNRRLFATRDEARREIFA
jgi:putative transposase